MLQNYRNEISVFWQRIASFSAIYVPFLSVALGKIFGCKDIPYCMQAEVPNNLSRKADLSSLALYLVGVLLSLLFSGLIRGNKVRLSQHLASLSALWEECLDNIEMERNRQREYRAKFNMTGKDGSLPFFENLPQIGKWHILLAFSSSRILIIVGLLFAFSFFVGVITSIGVQNYAIYIMGACIAVTLFVCARKLFVPDYRLIGNINITPMCKRYTARRLFFTHILNANCDFRRYFIIKLYRASRTNRQSSYSRKIEKYLEQNTNVSNWVIHQIFHYFYCNGGSILFEQVLANCIAEKIINTYPPIKDYITANVDNTPHKEYKSFLVFNCPRIEQCRKERLRYANQILSAMGLNEKLTTSFQIEFILRLTNKIYKRYIGNFAIIKTGKSQDG